MNTSMELAPSAELMEWLEKLNLARFAERYAKILDNLGYDDPNDLINFNQKRLDDFRYRLAEVGVKLPHIEKMIAAAAISGAASAATEQVLAVQQTAAAVVVESAMAPSPQGATATVQDAALGVGEAAASLVSEAHTAKVRAVIERQTKLCPEAPRILFGCAHDGVPVTEYNQLMNRVALELLKKNPGLVGFHGSKMKSQPLIAAARVEANALYGNFAKAGGSRAGGVAGAAGYRSGGGGDSSSGGGGKAKVGGSSLPATLAVKAKPSSRITGAVRATELTMLPQQIEDAHEALKAKRRQVTLLGQRSDPEDMREAVRLHEQIAAQQKELNAQRARLKELSQKVSKADADKSRKNPKRLELGEITELVPTVTAQNMPLPLAKLERVQSLADQLNNLASFERSATYVSTSDCEATTLIRRSPLEGFSLAEYVEYAGEIKEHLAFDCGLLIRVCHELDMEEGHLSLRELWTRAGGPPGLADNAQKMLDRLMRGPIVAVRTAHGFGAQTAWVVMAKESGVNYSRLSSILAAVQKPQEGSVAMPIPKARLRALRLLATGDSNKRLVELAAIDALSARAMRELTGRCHETAHERERRERAMLDAVETVYAYQQLADLDTLTEINAHLGGQEIVDSELAAELAKLKEREEQLLKIEEEDDLLIEAFVPRRARYDTEDVDGDLVASVMSMDELLLGCDVAGADELAERLKAAAKEAGSAIELDAKSLSDAGKQEELVQLFGEGWQAALESCLIEPLVPGRDDDSESEEEEDAAPTEETILDHAEELALDVRRELLEEGSDLMQAEVEGTDGSAELMLLANLTPKQLVTKMLARNRRRRQRQADKSEAIAAAQCALAGERGRNIGVRELETTLGKWPDIGDKVEAICLDLKVGADAKRRDGSLTINSAVKRVKGGVGFKRICLELEKRHGIELSSAAFHRLRVARDKRLKSSARCKGIINLRLRRSVKRIEQENMDDHAQNAVYRLLHHLRDRCSFDDTLYFERDDHSKVNEATTGASVTATGEGASALQHNFTNPVLSSLYATSILVSGCADGGAERCLALIKADKLAPSTPTQHYADFYMLQERAQNGDDDGVMRDIFFTSEGKVKPTVILNVDGGSDENPTGRETRFLQCELLMGGPTLDKNQRRAMVGTTTRHAGGSALNKVERLNGEMTQAATNFHAVVDEDVVGSLIDDATGQHDNEQLKAMTRRNRSERISKRCRPWQPEERCLIVDSAGQRDRDENPLAAAELLAIQMKRCAHVAFPAASMQRRKSCS